MLMNKVKSKKDIKNFLPEEIYIKLPEQLKGVKVSKSWEKVLNLANLVKENKENITKFGTGIYVIGKKTITATITPPDPSQYKCN